MKGGRGPLTGAAVPACGRLAGPVGVVAVCTLALGVASSLGFVYGFIAILLRESLDVSRAAVGLLVSLYFGSTGIGSILGGRITDRLGARLAVALDLSVVAVIGLAIALLHSYAVLVVGSVVAGCAYSLANAGTNVAIGAAVPISRRGIALTTKTAGVPVMAVVTAFSAPWAATRFGWPAVIGVIAGVAALTALVALLVLPEDRPDRRGAAGPQPLPSWFGWVPVGAFLLITGSQPLFSWIVPYLDEAVGVSATAAGGLTSAATAVAVVGMLLLAQWSDRQGPQARLTGVATLCCTCAVGVAVTASGARLGAGAAVVGAAISLTSQLGAIGIMHAAVVDLVPRRIGRASGVTMTGYYLGALVSPVTFGFLVDRTGSYTVPWMAALAALVLAALTFVNSDRHARRWRANTEGST